MKRIFLGKFDMTRLKFSDEDSFDMFRLDSSNDGKSFKLVIEDRKRTLPQNSLYWAYLHIISRETGNDIDDLHNSFRYSFLPPQFIEVNNINTNKVDMVSSLRSTTSLSTAEFTEYMQRIEAETGIPIPNPEDVTYYFEE